MNDLLQVPTFARLTDYLGLWAMSDQHFSALWSMAQRIDMKSHAEDEAAPLRSLVERLPGPGGQSIAVIKATGVLMKSQSSMGGTSTIQLRREIRSAAADAEVGGILLAFDSPGGTVAGTEDLASEVRAARRQKPVYAHADDLMASAAYWVGSQADKVYANNHSAQIGSIGTYQVLRDFSVAAEREGVRTLVVGTGPLKGMGVPGTKVTDEQVEHVRSLVDATQLIFDDAVRKGRNMGAKELEAVRHGGVMTAGAAVDARLIDGVQPLSRTLNELSAAIKQGRQRAESVGLPMVRHTLPMLV